MLTNNRNNQNNNNNASSLNKNIHRSKISPVDDDVVHIIGTKATSNNQTSPIAR